MKTPIFAIVLAATFALAACAEQTGPKQAGGGLIGAALGGLAGSQIGHGTGRLAAVGAGVLLGGLLGSEVGRSLDKADRLYADRTAQQALESAPTGRTSKWVNPDSGHSGTVTPERTYTTAQGQPCREYTTTVDIGGRSESAHGTACREADGTWRLVQ